MLFTSLAITSLPASVGLVGADPLAARQEALRFGVVSVKPSTVKLGQVHTLCQY
jgi:hypothetical protein